MRGLGQQLVQKALSTGVTVVVAYEYCWEDVLNSFLSSLEGNVLATTKFRNLTQYRNFLLDALLHDHCRHKAEKIVRSSSEMFVMITANALNEPVIDFIEMSYGIVLSRGYTIDNPIPLVVAEKINDYPFLLGHWEISNSSHGFRLNGSKGIEVYDLSTAQGQTGYPIRKAAEEAALQLEGRK